MKSYIQNIYAMCWFLRYLDPDVKVSVLVYPTWFDRQMRGKNKVYLDVLLLLWRL